MSEQKAPAPTDIVGHVTYDDGPMQFRHEPLTREVADALLAHVDAEKKRRAETMPDEQSAIRVMFDGWVRLKDFGWHEATYAPADGSPLELIEAGSTGIHHGFRDDERRFWIQENDTWPSRPVLYRVVPKMSELRSSSEEQT